MEPGADAGDDAAARGTVGGDESCTLGAEAVSTLGPLGGGAAGPSTTAFETRVDDAIGEGGATGTDETREKASSMLAGGAAAGVGTEGDAGGFASEVLREGTIGPSWALSAEKPGDMRGWDGRAEAAGVRWEAGVCGAGGAPRFEAGLRSDEAGRSATYTYDVDVRVGWVRRDNGIGCSSSSRTAGAVICGAGGEYAVDEGGRGSLAPQWPQKTAASISVFPPHTVHVALTARSSRARP